MRWSRRGWPPAANSTPPADTTGQGEGTDGAIADKGHRADKSGAAGNRGRGKKVNARMLETIQSRPEAIGWNCRQWAQHLKCGRSSVVETSTWQDLKMGRERNRAERVKDRRRKPKASDQKRD
jgi:hypothetical protein